MIFLDDFSMRLMICLLGVAGFFVAKHIRDQKKKANTFVCLVGFDCDGVVRSDYSKIFGISVELLGMVYYALISVSYFLLLFYPSLLPIVFTGFIALTSLLAFVFSAYLIGVQIFILKKGCSWCFVSALISILIFALSVIK